MFYPLHAPKLPPSCGLACASPRRLLRMLQHIAPPSNSIMPFRSAAKSKRQTTAHMPFRSAAKSDQGGAVRLWDSGSMSCDTFVWWEWDEAFKMLILVFFLYWTSRLFNCKGWQKVDSNCTSCFRMTRTMTFEGVF